MKFLVPVDFSEQATNASRFALSLATKTNGTVHFIHIVEPYGGDYGFPLTNTEERARVARKKLKLWSLAIAEKFNALFRVEVKSGQLTQAIKEAAEKHKCDYIIMGTAGARGLKRLLLGSVTSDLAAELNIPVLAIPVGKHKTSIKKIVYAVDYHDSDVEDLKKLAVLAMHYSAKILIMHVDKQKEKKVNGLSMASYFKDIVKTNVNYRKISFHVIEEKNSTEGIRQFLEKEKPDVFCMAMRKRNLFTQFLTKSKTAHFLLDAQLPVLAFHVRKVESQSEL